MKTKIRYNGDGTQTIFVNGKELQGAELRRYKRRSAIRERDNLAEMAATGKTPTAVTNDSFLGNRGTLADQFDGDPDVFKQVVANAKGAGYTPGSSDVYLSSLAEYPGDPKAFVSRKSGGRGRVAEVCKERGTGCRGSVNVKSREPESPPEDVRLGNDLVDQNVEKMINKDPELQQVDRRDLQAEAIAKHGAQKL